MFFRAASKAASKTAFKESVARSRDDSNRFKRKCALDECDNDISTVLKPLKCGRHKLLSKRRHYCDTSSTAAV